MNGPKKNKNIILFWYLVYVDKHNQKLITSLEVFELFECLICLFEFPKQKIVLEKEKGFRQKKKYAKDSTQPAAQQGPTRSPLFFSSAKRFLTRTHTH